MSSSENLVSFCEFIVRFLLFEKARKLNTVAITN